MNDEIIRAQFYKKEIQLTKDTTGEHIIEKILKTNKNKIYREIMIHHLTVGSIKYCNKILIK